MIRLKDNNNGDYTLTVHGQNIELDLNDLLKLKNINTVKDFSTSNFDVAYVPVSATKSDMFGDIDASHNIQFVNKITDAKKTFQLSNFEFELLNKELSSIKIDTRLPFQEGETIYSGSIGFTNNQGDWIYFTEPVETKVVSVDKVTDTKYNVEVISSLGTGTLTFENNKQVNDLSLVLGETRELTLEAMVNRSEELINKNHIKIEKEDVKVKKEMSDDYLKRAFIEATINEPNINELSI